ncbi:hypothetical protein NG799_01735 [Laspinema sp. D1]|uniref:Uncharacterized protein n=2 Tax=Laspinema TaxID=2584823 RepID=A0ABT2MJY4_9CYAN|nr:MULTISPECIES: hypothetical protein [unclassified Laspinema]MCT7965052.1 hypothetical protein [Laspinema sp. D2a]MCT7977661.1 hypothetical protein [Laspinema sp. D3b]MCT7992506.1 hypothetical protein [Laspinema sp. D3c]
MSSGFGRKTYHISLETIDLFRIGKGISVASIQNKYHIEIKSAAKLIQKDPQHLVDWVNKSGKELKRCTIIGSKLSILCISVSDYVEFVQTECENDNPYAEQIMYRSVIERINTRIQSAREAGNNHFEFNGQIVRFQVIDGESLIMQEDLAELLGITLSDLQSKMQSAEFNQYNRSVQGWM